MRIALITLALTALVFIGSIVYSLLGKEGGLALPIRKQESAPVDSSLLLEIYKNQIKTQEENKLRDKKIDNLIGNQSETVISQNTSESTATGKVAALPLSGKFLAKVMPTLEFSLVQNSGIYELLIFDKSTDYSTYLDAKQGIKAIPLSIKYDVFLKNMKAVGTDVYAVNETKTFPFRSFYVNPPKADTLVRLVIEVESQCIVLEIPKTRFPVIKSLLLKK